MCEVKCQKFSPRSSDQTSEYLNFMIIIKKNHENMVTRKKKALVLALSHNFEKVITSTIIEKIINHTFWKNEKYFMFHAQ